MEFCKKKEENCEETHFKNGSLGNIYSYLGFKQDTHFFICFVVGKWNEFTCNEFYEKLAKRLRFPTRKRRVTIFSDGNKQNIEAIQNHFPQGSVNYGQLKKIRYKQKIAGVVQRVLLGNTSRQNIHITSIDGFCSKLRERISCFTRKARSFAKRKTSLENRLEIFSIQHNFIEKKKGKTPAMKEGIIDRVLNWSVILHARLTMLK